MSDTQQETRGEAFERLLGIVDKLRASTHRFRDGMGAAGFELRGARDHPICPVMLGDARVAAAMDSARMGASIRKAPR